MFTDMTIIDLSAVFGKWLTYKHVGLCVVSNGSLSKKQWHWWKIKKPYCLPSPKKGLTHLDLECTLKTGGKKASKWSDEGSKDGERKRMQLSWVQIQYQSSKLQRKDGELQAEDIPLSPHAHSRHSASNDAEYWKCCLLSTAMARWLC